MNFSWSLFVIIVATTIAVLYQQDTVPELMRGFLRSTNINTISKIFTPRINRKFPNMSTTTTTTKFVGLPVIPSEDPSLNAASPKPRGIQKVFEAIETSEGAGARVRRSIGTPKLRHLTPFLMLDHLVHVGVGAGFPDHPHRGQETITYLLSGALDHEDFAGHRGTLYAGDLQFMTAGRGIVHAEMPHAGGDDGTPNAGLQLWVDLPKALKATEPRYRDLRAAEIPRAATDDGKVAVKVISGRSQGVDSLQELAYTPVWLLDVTVQPGGRLAQALPAGWNAFAYVLEGTATVDTGATKQAVPKFHIAVLEQKGDQIIAEVPANATEAARFIVVAGMPLDQPIVQYGPFVLTNPNEVRQAVMDYSTYSNGFERAEGWQSEIGKVMG